ncbi:PREDICTED: ATP-binding cassette sub-family G member 5 [Nicrophorus vespilloides]|uniref:ATP-binding cassette sub-family G member 5 n=1 Tax=Nicrophorus vespilloides TaxID=110193 RepID=A0ABM1NII1_NICVS|nr:PREDICTED: ATP-binding cassette sub-family G member 5 [Nicrophorus vespilloides]
MISSDYILELCNVFHSGQVEPGSCMQRLLGSIKTGVILKDVSLTVHSGEVLAVLGSKGSGKKALLDVISRRVQGPTRGQILLNNQPMSLSLFQQRCGYVTHKCDLIPGLTVEQTLYFTPTKLSGYLKKSKVKQVMADLALSQVANRCTENLTKSEYRRLMIGVQLIKDPVILLLDEPTWDLDPLNTYLVISILSNAAKKYGTAIVLTMEKPRSDVFPFLERVLYLCLGDVVYTGGTRQMLEYFTAIGFPCPQLENPLMYYLCLSTVDRRSRERFVESNNQISALVEKFKIEGPSYRQNSISGHHNMDHGTLLSHGNKVPLLQGKPSSFHVGWLLYLRLLAATFKFKKVGFKQLFLRLFVVPLFYFFLWIFYREMKNYQHTFVSKSGLILNSLAGVYFLGILNTIIIYPSYRTRYYQEAQEGTYGGALFLITYNLVSLPFSFCSVAGASAIIYPLIGTFEDPIQYLYFSLILWACYIFSEQQTMAILMIVKDFLKAAIFSIYITCICITLSSGILRSIKGLQDWLFYLTYATQARYAAVFLSRQVFLSPSMLETLSYDLKTNCTNMNSLEMANFNTNPYCLYKNGQSFLADRYTRDNNDLIFSGILDFDMNLGMTFAFALGMIIFNLFLYLIPLPTFVKDKFRE